MFFLFFVSSSAFSFSQKAQKAYGKAVKCYKKKKFDKSIVHLDKAILYDSNFYKAYQLKAKIYDVLKREDSALKYRYIYAVKYEHDHETWQSLGVTFMEMNKYEKAEQCIDKAIKIEGSATLWNYLGVIQTRNSKFEDALYSFQNAFSADSSRMNITFNLGYAYLLLDSLDMSERYFLLAMTKKDNSSALPFVGLGMSKFKKGEYASAIELITIAMRDSEKNNCDAYLYRGKSYKQLGHGARACHDFRKMENIGCEVKHYGKEIVVCPKE
jgi:tetratricopeptide (TPR) repeat protein